MNTATKTAPEPWMSDRKFFDRCQVRGRTFNVVAVAFEVYEALKLQRFQWRLRFLLIVLLAAITYLAFRAIGGR